MFQPRSNPLQDEKPGKAFFYGEFFTLKDPILPDASLDIEWLTRHTPGKTRLPRPSLDAKLLARHTLRDTLRLRHTLEKERLARPSLGKTRLPWSPLVAKELLAWDDLRETLLPCPSLDTNRLARYAGRIPLLPRPHEGP